MARGYDGGYGYGVDYRQVSLRPQWNDRESLDPNYQGGGYGGHRMEPGQRGQASYGWFRQAHNRDLQASGGFEGRFGGQRHGRFDQGGNFRDPFDREHPSNLGQAHGYDRGYRGGPRGVPVDPQQGMGRGMGRPREAEFTQRSDGGVRDDNRFLRQYNGESVAFRTGRGYDRGYGWAEGNPGSGPGDPRRERTDERGSMGYNSGGFSEKQLTSPGRWPTGRGR